MLTCPNNPEHDTFVMIAMVPETWVLNSDGDCEEIMENTVDTVESDLTNARCQDCDAPAEIRFIEYKEECRYCGGNCPNESNDSEFLCDGFAGDIDGLYTMEKK